MKKIKILIVLFILSCFLPMMNVLAATGSLGIFGVTIPKDSDDWYYTGFDNKKTQESYQYYHNGGAIDTLNNEIPIQARTWDGSKNSNWLDLPKNQYVTWGNGSKANSNDKPGTYGLDIHRTKSGVFKTTHSGIWYLDENKLPASAK